VELVGVVAQSGDAKMRGRSIATPSGIEREGTPMDSGIRQDRGAFLSIIYWEHILILLQGGT
jgi:hypothetical protein